MANYVFFYYCSKTPTTTAPCFFKICYSLPCAICADPKSAYFTYGKVLCNPCIHKYRRTYLKKEEILDKG